MITIYRGLDMNIIFKENSAEIAKKYVVLDLDTFRMPDGSVHTACCVVENIPITELAETETLKILHAGLIENFAKREWSQCEEAITELTGKWGGDMDSYYADLQNRIELFKTTELPPEWTPIIQRF
jgi:hypothetical protein